MTDASTETLPIAGADTHAKAPFFPVSVTKLVVLSLCTLGLYELFWFYKNWCLVRERETSNISPFWRAVFGYFFCYAMFRRVRDYPLESLMAPTLPAGLLAAGWIVTTLLWKLPDPYWLICYLAVLFIVPVQVAARRVNETAAPGHDPNAKFTTVNWITIVVGGVLLVLIVVGSFLPES